MSETEPVQAPSFASALANKLHSFTSKRSLSFNNSPAHQSGKQSDLDHDISLPDSLNNSSQENQSSQQRQEPHRVKRRSIFATTNGNRRKSSPNYRGGPDNDHGKLNSPSQQRKAEKLEGDIDNNILPEDVNTPHNADISFPLSLLSKEHSFDAKDSPPRALSHRPSQLGVVHQTSSQSASPISAQSVQQMRRGSKSYGGFLAKLTHRRASSRSDSKKPIKPKESLFKRGMNRIRNSIRRKKTESDESRDVKESPEPREASHFSNSKESPELKTPDPDNADNADVGDEQPAIMLSRHQTRIGGRHESGGSGTDAKQSSEEQLRDISVSPIMSPPVGSRLVSPTYSQDRLFLSDNVLNADDISRRPSNREDADGSENRNSSLGTMVDGRRPFARTPRKGRSTLERRPGSYGDNMLKMQAIAVKKAMREMGFKTFLMSGLALGTFLLFIFGVITILSSLIALPFSEYVTVLWVGQFFHGMFLAVLSFFVLKVEIKVSREESEKNVEKHLVVVEDRRAKKKYKDYGLNVFGFLMMILSGLLMVLLARVVPNCRTNPYMFVVTELVTLIFNGAGYGTYYAFKNYFERKKVFGKRKQGFFFVPIYKDFMSDLYVARDNFNYRETTSSPSSRRTTMIQKTELAVKEEGIDKYKPKYPFQIVTELKVIACQLIVIVSYLEIMAVAGLIKLYNMLQSEDRVGVTVPLLLAYPIFIYIFAKIVYIIDERCKLNLLTQAYYLNTACAAMFFPIILFHVDELGSVAIICGSKVLHKIVVYVIFGVKIDFWKMDMMLRIKGRLNAAERKEAEKVEAILRPAPKRPSLKEIGRRDTLALKKIHDLEKEEEVHNHNHHVVVEKFAMRFMMMQANEILYSLAILCLILAYQTINVEHDFMEFANGDRAVYIQGIWIGLIVDLALLAIITVVWSFCKTYSFIEVNETFKKIMKKYAVDYAIINLTLFTTFLFLLQTIETPVVTTTSGGA